MGSPAPTASGSSTPNHNVAGKRMTQTEWHRVQLEKLLANPEKEVQLPTGPEKPKEIRPPKEMIMNVQGSSSGAGSGEFHVYKQNRRREYERLKLMDDEIKAEAERAAFIARQKERDALAEAKTAKNRAKRLKAKRKRGGDKLDEGEERKRKLGGAAVVFRRPGEEPTAEEDDEDEDSEGGRTGVVVEEREAEPKDEDVPAAPVAVVQGPAIVIHDDE